jgi:glycosyltransferase involved in cell wall biosynthesis
MKISIITICFNSQDTIAKTLQSIDQQSYLDYEHIVIDGASLDATLDIVYRHSNSRRKVFSKKDNGIYDAMNNGLRAASGDIIAFLNSDDIYAHSDVLSIAAKNFDDVKLQALFGDVEYFRKLNPNRTIRRYSSARFSPEGLSRGVTPAHPTLFLRKEVYQKYGFYDDSYKIAGDFDFIARVFRDDQIKYLYLEQVMVRMQLGGVSTSGLRSTLLLNKEILQACRKNNIATSYIKLLLRYPQKLSEYFFIAS